MARNIPIVETTDNLTKLDDLIVRYALNKQELDSYDKLCKKENAEIKQIMLDNKLENRTSGDYTVKCSTSARETINQDKMLELLKADWIERNGSMSCPYIKTKEYIDMDALETALYNDSIPENVIISLDSCRQITSVTTLRVSKVKKDKQED